MKVMKRGKNDLKEVKTNIEKVKKKVILEIATAMSRFIITIICKTSIFQLVTLATNTAKNTSQLITTR